MPLTQTKDKISARLVATRAVQLVAEKGLNSDRALEDAGINKLANARDVSFARSICLGTLRWYQQLEVILSLLLDKPLQRKHQDIHFLLLTALFQLSKTDIARHGIVSETVNIVYTIRKKWAKGLVNGVLRNYLRQADSLNNKINGHPVAVSSHPGWLLQIIQTSWPEQWRDITDENNKQAPMSLRINVQRSCRKEYLSLLKTSGIHALGSDISPSGITLEAPCRIERLPGFDDGLVSVQDIAPQLAAGLLDLQDGQQVLDACAAPGGKTAHIAEASSGKVKLTALELDPQRLLLINQNMVRLGHKVDVKQGDACRPETWWSGQKYDRILLDAPCSGSGVIRRHPDIKLLRRATDIEQLAQQQLQLLSALWPLLKVGGKLLYATCSILPQENENVINSFLSQEDHAKELRIDVNYGHSRQYGIQILPGEHQMDGFFYACLQKN
ncbi:ribosomal RNA small subunit methyltransferase B [bacterium BMS3Bbin11]|nr:ribosomal RNA small subunit methyltransferase B [bacterium BMS3Abin11]GBE45842.1 ribosomal RNA small subunit methyltransferase B [bacterium BMS3Bbin11]GMT39933.1 MAG: ribosomal RNA small subunit methyltransferase B [bacterium]HDH08809.1 16S rRNA (cytosine(967)-C(5))-methyltransferase RsmB [Gammaproteobacteria bacterium]HDH16543.1 16S rRNA (cytosine(967)-C(5))-methyltransferase RsmB [Gammaproteobacteria bacterium]